MAIGDFHDIPVDQVVGTKDPGRITQFLSLQFDNIKRLLARRPQYLVLDNNVYFNTASTEEQTLLSTVVPAKNFIHPNAVLRFEAIVTTVDGLATKQFTIKANDAVLFDTGVFSGTSKNMYVQAYLLSTGPASQTLATISCFHNTPPTILTTPVTVDFTVPVTISYNVKSGTAVAGQIYLRHSAIKYGRV